MTMISLAYFIADDADADADENNAVTVIEKTDASNKELLQVEDVASDGEDEEPEKKKKTSLSEAIEEGLNLGELEAKAGT